MMQSRSSGARWHTCIHSIHPPTPLRTWLDDTASLTAKLTAACRHFQVQLVRQSFRRALAEERRVLGLLGHAPVWQREVVLRCDGHAVVFARTVAPRASLSAWPYLRKLGGRSLGEALFADPRVLRGGLQFAVLRAAHPLRRAMSLALGQENTELAQLYARRSKFKRNQDLLLVTEVFLPPILSLSKHESPL